MYLSALNWSGQLLAKTVASYSESLTLRKIDRGPSPDNQPRASACLPPVQRYAQTSSVLSSGRVLQLCPVELEKASLMMWGEGASCSQPEFTRMPRPIRTRIGLFSECIRTLDEVALLDLGLSCDWCASCRRTLPWPSSKKPQDSPPLPDGAHNQKGLERDWLPQSCSPLIP